MMAVKQSRRRALPRVVEVKKSAVSGLSRFSCRSAKAQPLASDMSPVSPPPSHKRLPVMSLAEDLKRK